MFSTEAASMSENRAALPEPEGLPLWTEGVFEFKQAGAKFAPIVSVDCLVPNRLPRVVGEHPMTVEYCDEVVLLRAGVSLAS